jgi:hypothetical protein
VSLSLENSSELPTIITVNNGENKSSKFESRPGICSEIRIVPEIWTGYFVNREETLMEIPEHQSGTLCIGGITYVCIKIEIVSK